jgi:hypothetical protein
MMRLNDSAICLNAMVIENQIQIFVSHDFMFNTEEINGYCSLLRSLALASCAVANDRTGTKG